MSRIIEKVKKPKGDAIGGSYLLAHAKLKDQYKDLENLNQTLLVSLIGIGCAIGGTLLQYADGRILGSIILVGALPSCLSIPVCIYLALKVSLTYIFYGYWEWDAENDTMIKKKLF